MTILKKPGVFRRLPIPRAVMVDLITIEAPSSTSDGQGGQIDTWAAIATNVRGIIMDSSPPGSFMGGEFMALGALGEHVTHRIWLRIDIPGLNSTCRVLNSDGRHFRIHDVGHFGGNTLIQAEEVR